MPVTFSPIGELLMSTKRVAKESADWSKELGLILLDGIEDNEQGKQLAYDRVKGLHPPPQGKDRYPKDFDKWLTKVFGKSPEDGVAPWLSLEFWQQQVDKVLIQGIFARNVTQDEVAQRIRSVWPKLSISWLSARMEEVARSGLPRWMDQKFWATAIDPILLSGIRNAGQCQCEAVETVLQAWPQLLSVAKTGIAGGWNSANQSPRSTACLPFLTEDARYPRGAHANCGKIFGRGRTRFCSRA